MQSKALTYIILIFVPLAALAVGVVVGLSLKTARVDSTSSVRVVNASNANTNAATANTNSAQWETYANTNASANTNAATNTSVEDETAKSSLVNLDVDWLASPAVVDPASIGLKVVDPWAPKGTKVSEAYSVFNVGTIKTAPWQEKRLLLIDTACYGLCPQILYRVIDDRGGKGLVFLKNLSNALQDYDEPFFVQEENYDISGLHLPKTLSVASSGAALTLEEEDFSPATRFDDYVNRMNKKPPLVSKFVDATVGTIYENTEEGTFFVKNPDSSLKLYRLKFPFTLSDDAVAGHLVQSTSLALLPTNGTVTDGIYSPVKYFQICPPRQYGVQSGIDAKVTKAGTFGASEEFYVTKSASDPLSKDIYDSYVGAAQEKTLTLDQFTKDYGVIFWKDALGRWIRMYKSKYEPPVETECLYMNSAL